eukprot:62686_1
MALKSDDDLELGQFKFKNQNACYQGAIVQNILEIAYDIFTIVVSLLDVITDIMILIHFYSTERMTFFYISLTILVIAQLAYTMAFWWKYMGNYEGPINALFACCCLLPFSPILSYLFYFTSDEESPLYQYFENLFDFECACALPKNHQNKINLSKKQDALRKWVEDKLMKHLGFIIEALIEAFPQSILQLISIVYYSETHNYVSIFSIMLSMISVSTKSFILSVKVSYNWKSALFIWTSCLVDFVAIFCITSLIFYVPPTNDVHSNPFETLQHIWFYSTSLTVIPFTLIGSIAIFISYVWDIPECTFDFFVVIFFLVLLALIGFCLSTMVLVIAGFAAFALALIHVGTQSRLSKASDFYLPLVSFINTAKSVHVSDYYDEEAALTISMNQHKLIRLCCINRVLLEAIQGPLHPTNFLSLAMHESKLLLYLREQSVANNNDVPYIRATVKDIEAHSLKASHTKSMNKCVKWTDSYRNNVPKYFYDTFGQLNESNHCGYVALYCCLPLYFAGRCFNILFIFFTICYLYIGFDINVFSNDIPPFQTVMVSCYMGLVAIWIVLLYLVLQEQVYLSLILPSTNQLNMEGKMTEQANTKVTMQIMNYYHSVISQLVVQRYCVRLFGKDVTSVIIGLWGCGDYVFNNDD